MNIVLWNNFKESIHKTIGNLRVTNEFLDVTHATEVVNTGSPGLSFSFTLAPDLLTNESGMILWRYSVKKGILNDI